MGLQLPPELIEALSWIGCTWPEADETKLFHCGEYWGTFAEQAATHAEAAAKAVSEMLAENVALDISKLSQADRDDLKELVGSHPEWVDKVAIY